MSSEIKKYAYLDSVRGIAILLVLLIHTEDLETSALPPFLGMIQTRIGQLGVQLFYLASALTLFLSLRQRSGQEAAPKLYFFLRRFFRIAPLYWLAIGYYLWQDGLGGRQWLGSQPLVTMGNVVGNVAFIHGFNPYWINSVVTGGWSIGVEAAFYTVVPFLYGLYSARGGKLKMLQLFFVASIALAFVSRYLLMLHPLIPDAALWGNYLYFYLPAQFPVFIIGFIAFHKIATQEAIADWRSVLGFGSLVVADLLIRRFTDQYVIGVHVCASVGFAIIVVVLQRGKLPFLSNRFFGFVGRLSYSLYLTHFAAMYALKHYGAVSWITRQTSSPLVQMCIGYFMLFCAALLVSIATHRLIERPGIALGQRVIRSLEHRRTAEGALRSELPLSV